MLLTASSIPLNNAFKAYNIPKCSWNFNIVQDTVFLMMSSVTNPLVVANDIMSLNFKICEQEMFVI